LHRDRQLVNVALCDVDAVRSCVGERLLESDDVTDSDAVDVAATDALAERDGSDDVD
jgi:hypothetical protein